MEVYMAVRQQLTEKTTRKTLHHYRGPGRTVTCTETVTYSILVFYYSSIESLSDSQLFLRSCRLIYLDAINTSTASRFHIKSLVFFIFPESNITLLPTEYVSAILQWIALAKIMFCGVYGRKPKFSRSSNNQKQAIQSRDQRHISAHIHKNTFLITCKAVNDDGDRSWSILVLYVVNILQDNTKSSVYPVPWLWNYEF